MKQLKIIALLIAASILLCACPDKEEGHRYITIVNKSDIEVNVQMVWSGRINQADTLWYCRLPALTIETNSSHLFECANADRGENWENDFNVIPYIQFLIFDAAVYDETIDYEIPCEETSYTIPVLHYYQLTLSDLQRMNWTVIYPPEG